MERSIFSSALSLALVSLAFACSSAPPLEQGPPPKNEDTEPPAPAGGAQAPAPPETPPAPPPAPAPAPAIATARVHAGDVWDYAVTETALWIATDTTVERAGLDGASPAPVPSLGPSIALASDGTRIYSLLDHGSSYELFSMNVDGSSGAHHSTWRPAYDGEPGALSVRGDRIYMTATKRYAPAYSMIVSAPSAPPIGGGDATWFREELADARGVPPAFTADRLFALDYHRASAVGVSLKDGAESVDVLRDELPRMAGGIATSGTDVFVRTAKGIVKAAADAAAPTVVVSSATCSIFDPADGSESLLEDALAIDNGTIYTACRAGANVELRAYATADGALSKVIATQPWSGGVTRVRLTSTAVYWLSRTKTDTIHDELWRAAR